MLMQHGHTCSSRQDTNLTQCRRVRLKCLVVHSVCVCASASCDLFQWLTAPLTANFFEDPLLGGISGRSTQGMHAFAHVGRDPSAGQIIGCDGQVKFVLWLIG